MNEFREYKKLTQQITAPEHLKKEVLLKMKNNMNHNNNTGKFQSSKQSRHVVGRVAIAAALLVAIPLSVFAASKSKTLVEFIRGTNHDQAGAYEELLVTSPDKQKGQETPALVSAKDDVAEYRVLEAINDGKSMYIHMQVKPLKDDVMFIHQTMSPDNSVGNLAIPGVKDGTIQEYADSLGKTLRHADIYVISETSDLNGLGSSQECHEDGSMDIYVSGNSSSVGSMAKLKFQGYTCEIGESSEDRTEFTYSIENKNKTEHKLSFTTFDSEIQSKFGVTIDRLDFEQTDLDYYYNFTYHFEDKKPEEVKREDLIGFIMVDENGEFFTTNGPDGGTTGIVDNGDGTYSYASSIPVVDNVENLKFKVLTDSFEKIGAYSFSK